MEGWNILIVDLLARRSWLAIEFETSLDFEIGAPSGSNDDGRARRDEPLNVVRFVWDQLFEVSSANHGLVSPSTLTG